MRWFGGAREADRAAVTSEAAALAERLARLTQVERAELALLLARDIDEPRCVGALMRLSRLAQETATRILRDEFERESG